jgi:hypothetical protein
MGIPNQVKRLLACFICKSKVHGNSSENVLWSVNYNNLAFVVVYLTTQGQDDGAQLPKSI